MSNHGKKQKQSNLTSKITVPTSGGGKGKKSSKSMSSYMSSTPSYNLPEFTVTVGGGNATQTRNTRNQGIVKDLTRITVDRDGKRALFSASTGRIADKMHENTPESRKTDTSRSVQTVLKDWKMFQLPNKDEIS